MVVVAWFTACSVGPAQSQTVCSSAQYSVSVPGGGFYCAECTLCGGGQECIRKGADAGCMDCPKGRYNADSDPVTGCIDCPQYQHSEPGATRKCEDDFCGEFCHDNLWVPLVGAVVGPFVAPIFMWFKSRSKQARQVIALGDSEEVVALGDSDESSDDEEDESGNRCCPFAIGGGGGEKEPIVQRKQTNKKEGGRKSGSSQLPSQATAAAAQAQTEDKQIAWCEQGAIARHAGKTGELTMKPDSDKEVKLRWADGKTSNYIKAVLLTQATAAEVRAFRQKQLQPDSSGYRDGEPVAGSREKNKKTRGEKDDKRKSTYSPLQNGSHDVQSWPGSKQNAVSDRQDPKLVPGFPDWRQYHDSDGSPYYCNERTGARKWEHPAQQQGSGMSDGRSSVRDRSTSMEAADRKIAELEEAVRRLVDQDSKRQQEIESIEKRHAEELAKLQDLMKTGGKIHQEEEARKRVEQWEAELTKTKAALSEQQEERQKTQKQLDQRRSEKFKAAVASDRLRPAEPTASSDARRLDELLGKALNNSVESTRTGVQNSSPQSKPRPEKSKPHALPPTSSPVEWQVGDTLELTEASESLAIGTRGTVTSGPIKTFFLGDIIRVDFGSRGIKTVDARKCKKVDS